MGRVKEKKLIITFHTTTQAMAMEEVCKGMGKPGRMIPVPTSISAGCGLAWCASLEVEEELRSVMEENGLKFEAIHIREI